MEDEKKQQKMVEVDVLPPKKRLKRVIYSIYFCSSFVLLSIIAGIIANRKIQPLYSWLQGTRLESYGHYVAGLVIEQKINMQIDSTNDPLTEEEERLFSEHCKLLGDTHQFDQLVPELTARDKRFIVKYPGLVPKININFVLLSNSPLDEMERFGLTLERLYVDFHYIMHGSSMKVEQKERGHICFFENRAAYISAVKSHEKQHAFHATLGYYAPVDNCIYMFSRKHSLEAQRMLDKYDLNLHLGKKQYKGRRLQEYRNIITREKQKYLKQLYEDNLCTLRHEATHRLAHINGLHSQRNFEKKWLIEGIAQYFETEVPGTPRRQKKAMLISNKEKSKLFPWNELINSNEKSFDSHRSHDKQLAYSQSWLVVRYLIQHHKKAFFRFIQAKKETSALSEPLPEFQMLCNFIGLKEAELNAALNNEVLDLSKP